MSLAAKLGQSGSEFELVQLLRLVAKHRQQDGFKRIRIQANPHPHGAERQVDNVMFNAQGVTIAANQTSLSSGSAVVPAYVYEELLSAYHQESFSLSDFLNIFNDRYFKQFAKVKASGHLLLNLELDKQKKLSETRAQTLMDSLCQVAGVPNRQQFASWVRHAFGLGLGTRSLPLLKRMLSDYFDFDVSLRVKPVSKYRLAQSECSRLGQKGQNNQLGKGLFLGSRCWVPLRRINVTIRPKNQQELLFLKKDRAWRHELANMVRFYLRDKTEVAVFLKAPGTWYDSARLSSDREQTVRLGRGFHLSGSRLGSEQITNLLHLVKD